MNTESAIPTHIVPLIEATAYRFVHFGLDSVVYVDPLFRPEPHSTQIVLVDGHDGKLRQAFLHAYMLEIDRIYAGTES